VVRSPPRSGVPVPVSPEHPRYPPPVHLPSLHRPRTTRASAHVALAAAIFLGAGCGLAPSPTHPTPHPARPVATVTETPTSPATPATAVATAVPQPTSTRTPAQLPTATPPPTPSPTSTSASPATPAPTATPTALITITVQGQALELTPAELPWVSSITTAAAYSVSVGYPFGSAICWSLVSSAGISQAVCGGLGGGYSYPPFVEPLTYTACAWSGTDPADRPSGC